MTTDFVNSAEPERRLRLGYVTSDLHHQHPVDIFLQPVFEHHDREGFEVVIYYNGAGYDARTRRARKIADQWVEVRGWPDERVQRQIEADGIDILIDLSGHTGRNRLPVFARHPAPIQLCMVAYPHSTGMKSMDYFLADPVVAPETSTRLYSEKLLRLDRCIFCYPEDLHEVNAPREPRENVVFGSFNNIPKLTPSTIATWAEVLRRVPESRMLLKAPSFQDEGCVARYSAMFAEHGVDHERLIFRGPTSLAEMMTEYRDMDIALDPFPFNGGTTSQQALWASTPLVTLAGENFCQRMGASMLTQLGHPEWIAESRSQYVDIAVHLAGNRERLAELHRTINDEMRQSGLTDAVAYTRNLETLLRGAWREWCTSTRNVG